MASVGFALAAWAAVLVVVPFIMVFSAPLVLAAVPMSVIGLLRARRATGKHGLGLAVAGLVLEALVIGVVVYDFFLLA